VWSPIGSKIVAQLVGCAVIPQPYILAIDDDCEFQPLRWSHTTSITCTGHVPPNLPIRTDLLKNSNAGSVAYLLKSVSVSGKRRGILLTVIQVGEGGGRGNIIQQLQDLEYKVCPLLLVVESAFIPSQLAGAMKNVNGRMGSCTFGHGAMVLWDKKAYEVGSADHMLRRPRAKAFLRTLLPCTPAFVSRRIGSSGMRRASLDARSYARYVVDHPVLPR
jgi:hypothetical protein